MLHELAVSANATPTAFDLLVYVGIPMFLFVCGVVWGGVKFLARAAAYMSRSEIAQDSIAESNKAISEKLEGYVAKTDHHLAKVDTAIAVLEYAVKPRNGNGKNE